MDGKTYYMILGVSPAESPGGIRSAYRALARKLHPDVAGERATHAFQEISEAYDVLSDPQRRRVYNAGLRRSESGDVAPVRASPPGPATRPSVSMFGAVEGLNIEVVLTPEEGRRGCVVPIGVPVFRRCPECGGSGRTWLFPCLACGQQGTREDEEIVRLRIPPRARSGSTFEMPLQGLGIRDFYLRVHVFVERDIANERR